MMQEIAEAEEKEAQDAKQKRQGNQTSEKLRSSTSDVTMEGLTDENYNYYDDLVSQS